MSSFFGYSSIDDMFDGSGMGGSGANFSTLSHDDYVLAFPDDATASAHVNGISSNDGLPVRTASGVPSIVDGKVTVSGVTINFGDLEGTVIGNEIQNNLDLTDISRLIDDLPSGVSSINLSTKKDGTWSGIINRNTNSLDIRVNLNSDVNKSIDPIDGRSPITIFGHEIAHHVNDVNSRSEALTNQYISQNPGEYSALVAHFQSKGAMDADRDARYAINYGFEEGIVQGVANEMREDIGEKVFNVARFEFARDEMIGLLDGQIEKGVGLSVDPGNFSLFGLSIDENGNIVDGDHFLFASEKSSFLLAM